MSAARDDILAVIKRSLGRRGEDVIHIGVARGGVGLERQDDESGGEIHGPPSLGRHPVVVAHVAACAVLADDDVLEFFRKLRVE